MLLAKQRAAVILVVVLVMGPMGPMSQAREVDVLLQYYFRKLNRLGYIMRHIRENIFFIKREIETALEKAKRPLSSVKLLAVSKTFPVDSIFEAYTQGQRLFGENRIQELEEKASKLPPDIEWHLIGHLQSNKVAKAVELAKYIHSVDSEKLLMKIERIAEGKNKVPNLLFEVNVSGEKSKFGLSLKEIDQCVEVALKCRNVKLVGLMTMAPYGATTEEAREIFSALKREKERIEGKYTISIPELSMGMSSDFKVAIASGSTIVRVGTILFGNRSTKAD